MPLRIEGCNVRMTPSPDDAELAAQAFLEIMINPEAKNDHQTHNTVQKPKGKIRNTAYYRELSDKIRINRNVEMCQAMRCVAWCEQMLNGKHLQENEVSDMEQSLFRHTDTVNRDGGEVKSRWQHCLAEITLRQMSVENTDNNEVVTDTAEKKN
jgi:hypothetical protein